MGPWEVIGWALAALIVYSVVKAIVKDLTGRRKR